MMKLVREYFEEMKWTTNFWIETVDHVPIPQFSLPLDIILLLVYEQVLVVFIAVVFIFLNNTYF